MVSFSLCLLSIMIIIRLTSLALVAPPPRTEWRGPALTLAARLWAREYVLRLTRPMPSGEGADFDPALSKLEAWRGLAALAARGSEGEGLRSVEQELVAGGPVVLEAAAATLLAAAAPERRHVKEKKKKGKGEALDGMESGAAITAAAASHVALLLEALILRRDGLPSASFLLRCLVPASLQAATQEAAAAPALPSETTGRLARVAGALAPAMEMGRAGLAAVVTSVRELLPRALGATGLGHGAGEGKDGLLDQLQLALCLLASVCEEDAAAAVALVDGGGVRLVKEAFTLLLQEEEDGGGGAAQDEPVTESSGPRVITAALERAGRRQQAAWAAQATADGARRRRRRIALGVAVLAVLEGMQGKKGAEGLVALSGETALSLLPSALALHARLGQDQGGSCLEALSPVSGVSALRAGLVSLVSPWMPGGSRWRAAVAAGGVPAATTSQAGEPDGAMVVHILRDVVCRPLVLGRRGARPGECASAAILIVHVQIPTIPRSQLTDIDPNQTKRITVLAGAALLRELLPPPLPLPYGPDGPTEVGGLV